MRKNVAAWTAVLAFGQPALWENHMHEGEALEHAGRYVEARAAYELAVKNAAGTPDEFFRQAAAWNDLGLIDRMIGNYAQARLDYGRALSGFEKSRGAHSGEYAAALHNLAVLDYQEGRLDEA